MKSRLLLAFSLLFCLWVRPGKAQLLWEISGKGLAQPSYLYGTMHVADPRVLAMNDSAWRAFNRSQVLAGELVFDQSMMFQMMNQLFVPRDSTLDVLLTPEQYKVVKTKLEERMGMLASFADRMKPLFISVFLSEQTKPDPNEPGSGLPGLGGGGREPLDLHLQTLAKQREMEVVGLETMEEQMEAFNSIPLKTQAQMLYEQVVSDTPEQNGPSELERMVQLYQRQEIDSLFNLTSQAFSGPMGQKLLVERNQNMADRMEKLMATKRVFTGVGAAHLPGPVGIIALLRQRGYTVRPLTKPASQK
ncbi:MAG: TraB/GumN family protein [Bernardetiaceae bacterium]|nr:TraB/GumN family protein [Bernardetiaceae bacterium]